MDKSVGTKLPRLSRLVRAKASWLLHVAAFWGVTSVTFGQSFVGDIAIINVMAQEQNDRWVISALTGSRVASLASPAAPRFLLHSVYYWHGVGERITSQQCFVLPRKVKCAGAVLIRDGDAAWVVSIGDEDTAEKSAGIFRCTVPSGIEEVPLTGVPTNVLEVRSSMITQVEKLPKTLRRSADIRDILVSAATSRMRERLKDVTTPDFSPIDDQLGFDGPVVFEAPLRGGKLKVGLDVMAENLWLEGPSEKIALLKCGRCEPGSLPDGMEIPD